MESGLVEEGEDEKRESQKKLAEDAVSEVEERAKDKFEQRETNLRSKGKPLTEDRKLDASIKKNNAFVKKLRTMSEQQREALTKDFAGLNLTKYIQEAATAVAECKIKVTDVGCAVHICSLIVLRYNEFSALLLQALQKQFEGSVPKGEEKSTVVSKYRLGLRLVAELVVCGVLYDQKAGLELLTSMLSSIIKTDRESEHTYITVLLSFCRHCAEDVLDILPRKQRELFEKFGMKPKRPELIPRAQQKRFREMLHSYFGNLKDHLHKEHKALRRRNKENKRILEMRGELTEERIAENEQAQKAFEKLMTNMGTLSDILDEDMPLLPEEEPEAQETTSSCGVDISFPLNTPISESELDPHCLWEDEEIRQFYEDITDIKTLVPAIVYEGRQHTRSESSDGGQQSGEKTQDTPELPESKENVPEEGKEVTEELEVINLEDDEEDPTVDEEEAQTEGTSASPVFDDFVLRLPNCISKQMVDEFAAEFCMKLNSKGNRKKLVKQLFSVNRSRMDLVPFYARLVATLHPLLTDIGSELVILLVKDLKFKVRKKDTTVHIHTKLKTVRFLAELTKYGICKKAEAMRCLTILIQDFSPHSIEMACSMLEHCGRFLFRSPDSQPRARVILEMLVRKKTALHLTGHQIGMIDNAVFYCNPPESSQVARVIRPPMEEFLRKLLFKDLNKLTSEKILKTIRKLAWDDPEVFQMGIDCLSSAWRLKFSNIQCVASILSGLAPLQEEAVVCVVDNVLEDIRLGLELNTPRMNQRRVSMAKFLGELYNYQLVESNVVFHTLYSFLSFGWNPDGMPTPLDPPESYFRVRLVCILLDSCGHYFDHGSNKKKLDNFLLFFQCYMFKKRQPVPLEISNTVSDLLGSLRPKLTLFTTPQEAHQAALALEQQFKDKLGPVESSEGQETELDEEDELEEGETVNKVEQEEDVSEEEGDTDEDVMTSETQSEEEDEQFAVVSGPKFIPCTEDNELLAALDKMMSDSAQTRRNESARVPAMDAPVPLRSRSSRTTDVDMEEEGMAFTLLTKKGHKQQMKEIVIPSNDRIALSLKDSQKVIQHERKEMKKIVLDFEQRQEEEEYQAMIASQEAHVQVLKKKSKQDVPFMRGGRGGYQRGGARGRGHRNQHY